MKTNLDLVNEGDGFPYYTTDPTAYVEHLSTYYHFHVGDLPYSVGYVLPVVAEVLRNIPGWNLDDETRTLRLTGGTTTAERSAVVAATTAAMRETGFFQVLAGWRDELYPVYGRGGALLFDLERSASPLFGVVTYGVHMTAYVAAGDGDDALRIWVPRRARAKPTYGGMLDNSVAGGLATGEDVTACLVREAAEEASLPEALVRERARPAGCVTYFYVRDGRAGGEAHLLQPECEYVYDLAVPSGTELRAGDDEVEEFYLWTVEEVQDALARGEFKPNCALILLDFFVRHGILHPGNEKDYIEIVARTHRKLEFPTP